VPAEMLCRLTATTWKSAYLSMKDPDSLCRILRQYREMPNGALQRRLENKSKHAASTPIAAKRIIHDETPGWGRVSTTCMSM
jgi:hypothetical protein